MFSTEPTSPTSRGFQLFAPGKIVRLGRQSVLITEAHIYVANRPQHPDDVTQYGVKYKVVWWDGTSRHEEWVSPIEISTDLTPTQDEEE